MGTDDLHKKSTIKRPQRNLKPKKVILIICEGQKTERNYLQSLKESLNLMNVSNEIIPSPHPTPLQIINYAEQKVKESNEYDEIYCVFDRDTHKDFDKALGKAKNIKLKDSIFEVIVSDPCFEFWILLHFTQIAQNFHTNHRPCQAVQNHKDFKKNLPNYNKDYDFEDIINKHLATAIKNTNTINKAQTYRLNNPHIHK